MRIPLITSLVHYFKVVYSYTGKKLYIILLLFLFGGVSESVGLEIVELFCELPVIDLMYDHIYYNKEFISDIIEQEVSYYYVYLLRKFVY